MAVAKSTLIKAVATTVGALVKWSSLASGANNVYFDVNGIDCSKLIFLVANNNTTDVGSTCGGVWFGASDSGDAGTSWNPEYSARELGRIKVTHAPPTVEAKEALTLSSAGAAISLSVFGPFEAAQLKDTDGYINACKAKGASDAGRVKICAILVP
jgi:hypothetical protein